MNTLHRKKENSMNRYNLYLHSTHKLKEKKKETTYNTRR